MFDFKGFTVTHLILFVLTSCHTSSTVEKFTTVEHLDVSRFMGDWYVLAGRFTFLETDVHNGLEKYKWNQEENRIDVAFTYNKGSFDGKLKSIPQKAWIENLQTNAHWKVSPMWPFKFDYLVIDLDEDYRWTAIGVPNQKYLWIMARDWKDPQKTINQVLLRLKEKSYNTDNMVLVPHRWL